MLTGNSTLGPHGKTRILAEVNTHTIPALLSRLATSLAHGKFPLLVGKPPDNKLHRQIRFPPDPSCRFWFGLTD